MPSDSKERTYTITVRGISKKLRDAIKIIAIKEERSLSEWMTEVIEEAVAVRVSKSGKKRKRKE